MIIQKKKNIEKKKGMRVRKKTKKKQIIKVKK